MYAVEKEIREEKKSDGEILSVRKEKSLPILNELEKWLKENTSHPPRSPMAQAVAYIPPPKFKKQKLLKCIIL